MTHIAFDMSRAIGDLFLNNNVSGSQVLIALGLPGSSTTTNLYASLHTGSVPSAANEITTASYIAYARVAVPRTSTAWSSTAVGSDYYYYTNGAQIQFPTAGVGSSGTVRAIGLFDAATGGRLLFGGAFTTSTLNEWKIAVTSGAVGGTTSTVKCDAHGLSVGDKFVVDRIYDNVIVPTIAVPTAGTEYTVDTVVDADEFTVVESFTTNIGFMWIKSFQASGAVGSFISVTDGSVPTFATGAVKLSFM